MSRDSQKNENEKTRISGINKNNYDISEILVNKPIKQ